MNIYEKLSAIQTELKAPKSQYNTFGKYNYRSCEDITESIKPLLKAYKAGLTLSDELCNIGDRYYIKAFATFWDVEDTTANVTVTAYAREEETKKGMDGSQVTGAASSYARKYALNGLFAIDDTRDSDATNTHGKEENTPKSTSTKEPGEFRCADCHEIIIPWIDTKTGKTRMSVREIAQSSEKEYGRALCLACIKKERKKNETAD